MINSGAWGLALNIAGCLVVSLISQREVLSREWLEFEGGVISRLSNP